ncbi:MAG: transposase [Oligoflexales bacterium]
MGVADHWPGTFVPSAIKLHLAIDLLTESVSWLNFTEGSAHDNQHFPEHRAGALYLFDLGYWSSDHFHSMDKHGAFFMTRLKNGIKFTITEIVQGRISKSHVGKNLGDLKNNLSLRSSVVEILIKDPKSGAQYRAIGIWNKRHKQYH